MSTRVPRTQRVVELDGDATPFSVRVAGYEYIFEITNPADASFQVIEVTPDGDHGVLCEGSEW